VENSVREGRGEEGMGGKEVSEGEIDAEHRSFARSRIRDGCRRTLEGVYALGEASRCSWWSGSCGR
jgi:hypothetical protein